MTLEARIKTFPDSPGVYRFFDADQKILYIGKAKSLKKRVMSYLRKDALSHRIREMVSRAVDIDFMLTQSELEALILESNLVAHLQPPYNVLLKDDKSYAFIKIDKKHDFPGISKYRGIPKNTHQAKFFGPYPSIDEILEMLQKVFQLRNCSDYEFSIRKRPCLQYEIKRCTAPCMRYVSQEDYDAQIKRAIRFLEGHSHEVVLELKSQMLQHSEALEFEKAAHIRNILSAIKKMSEKQKAHIVEIESADILYLKEDGTLLQGIVRFHKYLGTQTFYWMSEDQHSTMEEFLIQFYKNNLPGAEILMNIEPLDIWTDYIQERHGLRVSISYPQKGPKRRLLDYVSQMQTHTSTAKLKDLSDFFCREVKRVEAYDNSHLFGEQPYGVMVVFGAKGFEKASYRKFKVPFTNDYDMMEDMVKRRINHPEWPFADLMLIDGGMALVRMVKRHAPSDILVLGLAKGEGRKNDRLFDENGIEITLTEPVKFFLQNMRDEAHRFAITTHRHKRESMAWKSSIDQIPGIGLVRKKKLLQHFGSAEKVAQADMNALTEVMPKNIAEKIYRYFRG